jgi:ABC-type transport system involved in cytochrome c biogenesis ATPase subunit
LDEPFTGIDYQGRELIENICAAHLHQNGLIILTNHQSLVDTVLAPFLAELALSASTTSTVIE